MKNMAKEVLGYKVSGFKFQQQFLDDFRLVAQKTEDRITASSLTVFLTMMAEIDEQKRADGVLTDYNLSKWARRLSIKPQSLWNGYQILLKNRFIEEIIFNGRPAIIVRDYADYDNPAKNKLNYLTVPHMIFDTSVLRDLVRISCPNGIIFMLEVLNQTRTRLGRDLKGKHTDISFNYNMDSLKKKLGRRAAGVRRVLDILSPVFHIKATNTKIYTVNPRSNKKVHTQVWIKGYQIGLKEEFYVVKKDDNKKTHQLMALANKSMIHYFKLLHIPFSQADKNDFVTVFRFEVIEKLKILSHYSQHKMDYIDESKKLLIKLFERLEESAKKDEPIKIRSIGGFFRSRLIDLFDYHVFYSGEVDYSIIHDAKVAYYQEKGVIPLWLEDPRKRDNQENAA